MLSYLGQRIIDGDYTYEYIISKKPSLKSEIDSYLTEKGKTNLMVLSLDNAKTMKIQEIKMACQQTIINGFDSVVKYGVTYHYSLMDFKRENMKDQEDRLRAGIILYALWSHDGMTQHDVWTKTEYLQLCKERDLFMLKTRLYSDSLEKLVKNADTLDEIEDVYWGMELSEEEVNFNQNLMNSMRIQI
jgi:hypothetical protein